MNDNDFLMLVETLKAGKDAIDNDQRAQLMALLARPRSTRTRSASAAATTAAAAAAPPAATTADATEAQEAAADSGGSTDTEDETGAEGTMPPEKSVEISAGISARPQMRDGVAAAGTSGPVVPAATLPTFSALVPGVAAAAGSASTPARPAASADDEARTLATAWLLDSTIAADRTKMQRIAGVVAPGLTARLIPNKDISEEKMRRENVDMIVRVFDDWSGGTDGPQTLALHRALQRLPTVQGRATELMAAISTVRARASPTLETTIAARAAAIASVAAGTGAEDLPATAAIDAALYTLANWRQRLEPGRLAVAADAEWRSCRQTNDETWDAFYTRAAAIFALTGREGEPTKRELLPRLRRSAAAHIRTHLTTMIGELARSGDAEAVKWQQEADADRVQLTAAWAAASGTCSPQLWRTLLAKADRQAPPERAEAAAIAPGSDENGEVAAMTPSTAKPTPKLAPKNPANQPATAATPGTPKTPADQPATAATPGTPKAAASGPKTPADQPATAATPGAPKTAASGPIICHNCGQPGHIKKGCRAPAKN